MLSEQLEGAIKGNVSDDEKRRMEEQQVIPSDAEIEYNEDKRERQPEPGSDAQDVDEDNAVEEVSLFMRMRHHFLMRD